MSVTEPCSAPRRSATRVSGQRNPFPAKTQDTVFRIGSVTKTVTAIAVMQLWEQGLVDLDAPASDYLPASSRMRCLPVVGLPGLDRRVHRRGVQAEPR
jgi:CubicO group peptidase (beta-lactamase class C family)